MTKISKQIPSKSRQTKTSYTGKKYPCISRHKPLETQTDLGHMALDLFGADIEYLQSAFTTRKKQRQYLESITPILGLKEQEGETIQRHELSRKYNQLVQLQRKKISVQPEEFLLLYADAQEYWPINFHIIRKLAPYYPKKE